MKVSSFGKQSALINYDKKTREGLLSLNTETIKYTEVSGYLAGIQYIAASPFESYFFHLRIIDRFLLKSTACFFIF